jgi:hypothetical protein
MKKITVRDLKDFLKDIPDNYTVILSKDGEGNLFSPMSKNVSLGKFEPKNALIGDFEFDDETPTSIAIFPVG